MNHELERLVQRPLVHTVSVMTRMTWRYDPWRNDDLIGEEDKWIEDR
jgi:hypothetical protein